MGTATPDLKREQVLACLLANPHVCQFKVSCLAAAALHYRRASVTTPFPAGAGFETAAADRDYASLQKEIQSLPSLASLAAAGAAQGAALLTLRQVALLHWLLCGVLRPASGLRAVSLEGMAQSLPSLGTGWLADLALNPAMRPQRIIALQAAPLLAGDRLLAFHGTSFENMHSILHNGLLNLSGTRLERTGSAFGQGIYLSTEMSVAYAFSLAADACRSAVLGGRLRCLLVCGVEREHAAAAQGDGVPDKYLVVQRSDAITPLYAFLYCDDGSDDGSVGPQPAAAAHAADRRQPPLQQEQQQQPAPPADRPVLLIIVLAYVLWMLLRYCQANWYLIRRSLARLL